MDHAERQSACCSNASEVGTRPRWRPSTIARRAVASSLDLEREHIAVNTLLELGREATLIRPKRLRTKLTRLARDVLKACDATE